MRESSRVGAGAAVGRWDGGATGDGSLRVPPGWACRRLPRLGLGTLAPGGRSRGGASVLATGGRGAHANAASWSDPLRHLTVAPPGTAAVQAASLLDGAASDEKQYREEATAEEQEQP
jgi:hypothetical protein